MYIRADTSGLGATPASFNWSNPAVRLRLPWSLSLLELAATNSSAIIGANAAELLASVNTRRTDRRTICGLVYVNANHP